MFKKIQAKIQSWETIQASVSKWKSADEKVIFTNGCFDILHFGHIHYLAEASDLGDRLVIGLNSAASVKRLKGEHRPINDEATRQHLLAALEFVDAVRRQASSVITSITASKIGIKHGDKINIVCTLQNSD